jgi:hypothetical protein
LTRREVSNEKVEKLFESHEVKLEDRQSEEVRSQKKVTVLESGLFKSENDKVKIMVFVENIDKVRTFIIPYTERSNPLKSTPPKVKRIHSEKEEIAFWVKLLKQQFYPPKIFQSW